MHTEETQPYYANIRLRPLIGFSMSSLIIAGVVFLIWLVILLPAYYLPNTSLNQNLVYSVYFFIFFNLIGLCSAIIALIMSHFKKPLAYDGLLANIIMIVFNLSLLL